MGTASRADAVLVSRNVGVTLNASTLDSYALDVDQNGVADFTFETAYVPDPVLTVGFDQIRARFGSGNGIVIDSQTGDGFPPASRLASGNTVSSASLFATSNDDVDLYFYDTLDPITGNFGGQTGFVGFRFDGAGGSQFGYAQVTVRSLNDSTGPFDLTIGRVVYSDTAGTAVQVAPVPEPTVLAAAGMAGIALRLRRPRRAAVR